MELYQNEIKILLGEERQKEREKTVEYIKEQIKDDYPMSDYWQKIFTQATYSVKKDNPLEI